MAGTLSKFFGAVTREPISKISLDCLSDGAFSSAASLAPRNSTALFLKLGFVFFWIASPAFAADINCYVDSQNGDDMKSGLSEAEAVKSQSAIGSNCTVIQYKRGSVFNEALNLTRNAKVYTNYGNPNDPLPQFVVPRVAMSGPVVEAMMYNGITIDGLYISGSSGDGTMANLMGGICVMLGANSKLLNNEITDCDIGIMLTGEGSLVQGNTIHDLIMGVDAPPGIDPNLVGGAEGIFINASNNEVAYNTFIRCKGPAEWVGMNGGCDGGATEVTVRSGRTMTGVKVHHNFSYDNCGFFEVATGFGDAKGTFADSQFYNNVTIDSGWMGLLQVNNTDLRNIEFYNNTLVQHANSTNAGLLWIIFTDTSSGMTGGELVPGTVFLSNNLFVFDGVMTFGDPIDPAFEQTTNLIIRTSEQNPGFVNINGDTAEDFDLTASSPAINAGTLISNNTLDFLNRTVPDPSGLTDIGAFEYGATGDGGSSTPPSTGSSTGGSTGETSSSTGGTPSTAGANPGATGGTTAITTTGGVVATEAQGNGGTSGYAGAASLITNEFDPNSNAALPEGSGKNESNCGCRTVGQSIGTHQGFGFGLVLLMCALLLRRR